jgi:hypothetical protein
MNHLFQEPEVLPLNIDKEHPPLIDIAINENVNPFLVDLLIERLEKRGFKVDKAEKKSSGIGNYIIMFYQEKIDVMEIKRRESILFKGEN